MEILFYPLSYTPLVDRGGKKRLERKARPDPVFRRGKIQILYGIGFDSKMCKIKQNFSLKKYTFANFISTVELTKPGAVRPD